MGISPIEYSSWKGQRRGRFSRISTIIKKTLDYKLHSLGVLILLIFGILAVHTFPIIFGALQPHQELTADMLVGRGVFMQYLAGPLFAIFAILLAAVISSDLIAEDFNDNSFILYFSRPVRPLDYLIGKIGGAFGAISIFSLLSPLIFCVAIIATQSGDDYWGSLEVMGRTVIAGAFASIFYLLYGVMLSSFTKHRAYAGVGTFMSFFVLTILSQIFFTFDADWLLISPVNILNYTFRIIYGLEFPSNVNYNLYLVILFSFILVPLVVVYLRLYRRSTGR